MKNIIGAFIVLRTLQGCMASPFAGAAAGLGGLVEIKKSGEQTTVWATKVDRMNCSQKRAELVRLQKKNNILSSLKPADNIGQKVSALKSTMIWQRCRLPA